VIPRQASNEDTPFWSGETSKDRGGIGAAGCAEILRGRFSHRSRPLDKTMESSEQADDGDHCQSSVCHFGFKFGSSPEHDQITKAHATWQKGRSETSLSTLKK